MPFLLYFLFTRPCFFSCFVFFVCLLIGMLDRKASRFYFLFVLVLSSVSPRLWSLDKSCVVISCWKRNDLYEGFPLGRNRFHLSRNICTDGSLVQLNCLVLALVVIAVRETFKDGGRGNVLLPISPNERWHATLHLHFSSIQDVGARSLLIGPSLTTKSKRSPSPNPNPNPN